MGVDDGSQGFYAPLLQRHMHGRVQLEGCTGGASCARGPWS